MKITKSELKQLVEQEMGITEGWFDNIFKKQKPAPPKQTRQQDSQQARQQDSQQARQQGAAEAAAKAKALKSPKDAVTYAIEVIKGRFPEGEKIIASDPISSHEYARKIIKGRWKEGEKIIASDPNMAQSYAQHVIRGPWPEAEKIIASNPISSHEYARNVVKGRFPEGEKAIAKEPQLAQSYAQYVIRGPWPEAEDSLASDAPAAFLYAKYVLNKGDFQKNKKRFLKGEEVISRNRRFWELYSKVFGIKKPGENVQPEGKGVQEEMFINKNKIMKITKSELKQMIKEELYNKN